MNEEIIKTLIYTFTPIISCLIGYYIGKKETKQYQDFIKELNKEDKK